MCNSNKEEEILLLADAMAAAAADFNAHSYDNFIRARDQLKEAVHDLAISENFILQTQENIVK